MIEKGKRLRIKAVFFDLDGVLVDTYRVWYQLFNQTLQHFGYKPVDLKTFALNWGRSTEDDVKIFMPGVKLNDVIKYFSENFSRFIKYMKVDSNAKIVLKALKKSGLKTGCITNSHKDITELELKKSGLKDLIDITITSDDVKRPKPDPEMLLKACKRLGVKIDEIIFIGDTITDLETAKRARCVFIGYKMQTPLKIKKLTDLIPLIKKNFLL
ncbi:MAG: HAD family hydrolase [candidate division WOR-3 bacterium]|nr:HAD family hydrolase [candidate division WOR-3 bacterium]